MYEEIAAMPKNYLPVSSTMHITVEVGKVIEDFLL
jgi:hypothetical protein